MNKPNCCEKCLRMVEPKTGLTPNIWPKVPTCINATCDCHTQKAQDKLVIDEGLKNQYAERRLLPIYVMEEKTHTMLLNEETPIQEEWVESFISIYNKSPAFNDTVAIKQLTDFISNLLDTQAKKDREVYVKANSLAFESGKQQAHNEFIQLCDAKMQVAHLHSRRCKIDEPYCLQRKRDIQVSKDAIYDIISQVKKI